MTAISIHRWHSRYRAQRPQPDDRVAAWNAALARLEPASLDAIVGDDEWVCVRTLPLALRIREHDGDVQAAQAWSESLAERLARELREGSPANVVRYRDRRDALADFLYRAAVGDSRRAWAWRQMGLLDARGEATPSRGVLLAQAVQALAAQPAWIEPTLARLVAAEGECGAWTALAQSLDAPQWHVLLAASARTRALERIEMDAAVPVSALAEARGAFATALLAWAAAHVHIARRIERVLAIWIAAEALPHAASGHVALAHLGLARAQVRAVLDSEGARVTGRASMRDAHERPAARREALAIDPVPATHHAHDGAWPEDVGPAPVDPSLELQAGAEAPEAPPLPDAVEVFATQWAGLLFLVNVLPEVDYIERCAPRLPAALRHLAVVHLGIPPEDAAVRAFCGGMPLAADDAIEDADDLAAARAAADLRALLARRIGLEEDVDPIDFVCRRPGVLRFESGWIELAMDAASADVRLRRTALDLDPGYVPWLGCVVRFRYE